MFMSTITFKDDCVVDIMQIYHSWLVDHEMLQIAQLPLIHTLCII